MGLLDNIFGHKNRDSEESGNQPEWIPLVSEEQLDSIGVDSKTRPQILFKHSTSCGISRMVLNRFKGSFTADQDMADLYYLDIHAYRELSNEVARRYGIPHESPQLLVIRDNAVIVHDSHGGISALDLDQYL